MLTDAGCKTSDFSTRRRRHFVAQLRACKILSQFPIWVGTSNVHISLENGWIPKGTVAHEWTMAYQVFDGIRHCNRASLNAWNDVYRGSLGTALTDTIGTDAFYRDFDPVLSRLFDGVRHDSGSAFVFVDKTVTHYKSMGINPMTKTIIFSDSLDPVRAVEIQNYCKGKILCAFGIGTNFSNDYFGSRALNIVIKLSKVNGVPVVKLSDIDTKAIGDRDALRVARWEVFGTPLD